MSNQLSVILEIPNGMVKVRRIVRKAFLATAGKRTRSSLYL